MLDMVHENMGLLALNGTPATPEQQSDLIAFGDIGPQYQSAYINQRPKCSGATPLEMPANIQCSEKISKEVQSERAWTETSQ